MLFRFLDFDYDGRMKRFLELLFSISFCLLGANCCFAELVPIDGSDNSMDNGAEAGELTGCVDIEFIFARGSGAEYMNSDMWFKYESEMSKLARRYNYSFRVTDVDYPAVSIIDPITNAVGAYVSAGKYYEFGRSVRAGVDSLRDYYDEVARQCPDSLWVLAGYSQGSMVVAQAVTSFRYDKVVYVALFTDPQLYLPEGAGLFPDACSGNNLSEYRVYVPVCRTYKGRLGARNPYQYGELAGKYGLWCGRDDYICGSTNVPWLISGHTKYVERIPQLTSILKRRLARNVVPATVTRSMENGDVAAILSLDEYYAHPGEEIRFDASHSFSLDADVVNYEWSLDDEEWWPGSAVIARSFNAEGYHKLKLRVTDFLGESAETQADVWIIVDDVVFYELPAPTEVTARKEGAEIVLEWDSHPSSAYYVFIRVNGYDLGYVDVSQNSVRLTDLEFSEELVVSVAWSTGKMNLSEFIDLEINADDGPSGDTVDIEAPNTGITFADSILPSFAIMACLGLVRRIMWA